jgi:hypothetical protein
MSALYKMVSYTLYKMVSYTLYKMVIFCWWSVDGEKRVSTLGYFSLYGEGHRMKLKIIIINKTEGAVSTTVPSWLSV